MYLDLGRWITGSAFVLEWTPEEASLLQDRPSLLSAASVYISREHGKHTPDILYETCACILCIIHTISSAACSLQLKHSMINLSLLHLKIASDTPNHQLLGTRGPRDRNHDISVYETCACVIHNNLLSYIINVISH